MCQSFWRMCRLLVVEDQRELARVLRRSFLGLGHSVELVVSTAGALRLKGAWDCAVLDIDLPDGSGIELATQLLQAGVTRQVVFFSAQSDPTIFLRAEALGPFVPKQAGVEELMRVVERELRTSRAASDMGSGTFSKGGEDCIQRKAQ